MGLHDEQRIKKLLTTMKIEKHLLEDQEVHQEKGELIFGNYSYAVEEKVYHRNLFAIEIH